MPPKQAKKPPAPVSKSKELVTTGPKEIVAKKHHIRRDENGNKPTTARALVLRNGKHGAMGTGEVALKGKISGSEKLELLAEDLIQRYQQAIATPFNVDKALKIAEGQFIANLDEIQNLQDPELFQSIMESEVNARRPQEAYTKKNPDPTRNPDFVGRTVAARIHNTYMLASAWRLVGQTLEDIADELGGHDSRIRDALRNDLLFRGRYLELYNHVNKIVDAAQNQFALLATTAPHWHDFFLKSDHGAKEQPEFIFDWTQGKVVHRSFLDSIVVELSLPGSTLPKQVLLHILREAIEESPRDAKRFPQALWDAMGDFSMTVQLSELLEMPLLGSEGDAWKKEFYEKHPPKPEEFEAWADAQLFSLQAVQEYPKFQDMIYPLSATKTKATMQDLWKFINLNYQAVSGKTIDALWGLDDVKNRKPSWHATTKETKKQDTGYDSDEPPALVAFNDGKDGLKKPAKKPLTIENGYDSEGSMPSLQTVSDSSDDDGEIESESESEESEEESDYDSDDYDEEEEDRLRELWREAMDIVTADNDYSNPRSEATDFKQAASEKKANPYLKILGGLRGRFLDGKFSLRTTDRESPRHPYLGAKPPASAYKRTPAAAQKPKTASTKPETPKSQKATVEEISDEEAEPTAAKKKKKKKPKKKKKSVAKAEGAVEGAATTTATEAPTEPVQSTPQPVPQTPPAPPKAVIPKAKQPSKARVAVTVVPPFGSTASLPLYTEPQSAQSARTYLQSEGLHNSKSKVKTRSDGNERPAEKKSIFGRWAKKRPSGAEAEPESKEEELPSGDKHGFFSNLTKKTKTYMHQLLNTPEDQFKGLAPLKWENFLKVMREMGFTYDPSTAGSSVRFDPPNRTDPSITFHKPHPDTTIYPVKLRQFGVRLKRTYGWAQQDFFKAAANAE